MMPIQRTPEGFPIDEICPKLKCLVLIDSIFLRDARVHRTIRKEFRRFLRALGKDYDLSVAVRISSAYTGTLDFSSAEFDRAADFQFGLPSVEEAPLSRRDTKCACKLLCDESREIDFFGPLCLRPVLGVISDKEVSDLGKLTDEVVYPQVVASYGAASLRDFFQLLESTFRRIMSEELR